jgi:hypothetical protein
VDALGGRMDGSTRGGTDNSVEGGVMTESAFLLRRQHSLIVLLAEPRRELDDARLGGVREWESEVGEAGSLRVDEEEHVG